MDQYFYTFPFGTSVLCYFYFMGSYYHQSAIGQSRLWILLIAFFMGDRFESLQYLRYWNYAITSTSTAPKAKFSFEDFFGKCDQIRRKVQIWSNLLKKSLMGTFSFFAVSELPVTCLDFYPQLNQHFSQVNSTHIFVLNWNYLRVRVGYKHFVAPSINFSYWFYANEISG